MNAVHPQQWPTQSCDNYIHTYQLFEAKTHLPSSIVDELQLRPTLKFDLSELLYVQSSSCVTSSRVGQEGQSPRHCSQSPHHLQREE